MEAAKGGVHERKAMIRGFEEQGVVVAADGSVEESESLRGEEVGVGEWLEGWLLYSSQWAKLHVGDSDEHTMIFAIPRHSCSSCGVARF